MHRRNILIGIIYVILLTTGVAVFQSNCLLHGQEGVDFWHQDTLTGNWGGLRSDLAEKGVTLEMIYTGESVSILRGGIERKTVYLDNRDIVLSVDAQKLLGWKGAEFSLYVLGNFGQDPSASIGDVQVFSNIETDDTWKVYEAWYQQSFFSGRLSLKLGLYDLNSEFDVIECGGVFHNSSFGIGPDYSQSGLNGPSIFSTTSLTARLKVVPAKDFYVQAAVLDGVPGDPQNPKGTHVLLRTEDGLLLAAEMGWLHEEEGSFLKLALGAWCYTADADALVSIEASAVPESGKNKGVYVILEKQLWAEKDAPAQGLTGFLRLGAADKKINQLDCYLGFGLVYTGLIPGRDDDVLGLGVAYAHNGTLFREALGPETFAAETAIELVYHAQLTPWLALMPELQYIIHPGTFAGIGDALVLGVRCEIGF